MPRHELLLREWRRSSSRQEILPKSTIFRENQPIFHIFVKKCTFEFKGEDSGDAGGTGTLQLGCRIVQ